MNHKKRKTAVLFAFILLLGLFLTACSSGQNTSEEARPLWNPLTPAAPKPTGRTPRALQIRKLLKRRILPKKQHRKLSIT